jgi:phosphohistidine phosphatase
MKLYLVQHGDAVPETVDHEKPLSPKGSTDVERLARACKDYDVSAAEILHSGKKRAAQTAEVLATTLAIPVRASTGLDPLDPVKPFAEDCDGKTEDRIVVGHLPFLERLAALLVTGSEEPPVVAFQRGGMVCLEKRARNWCIQWTALPEQPCCGLANAVGPCVSAQSATRDPPHTGSRAESGGS